MTGIIASNITSPLGFTTEENYIAVKQGKSSLRTVSSWGEVPVRCCVSQFSPEQKESFALEGFTPFESLVIRSVSEALTHADVDMTSERTVFILSTTKGNVGQLSVDPESDSMYLSPGSAALKIGSYFGMRTQPLVVCNACISGTNAQILADRLISSGSFDTAVVCGADCLTDFTLAGFTSFKALSPYPCRPFDIDRLGLNLGEAAATVVMRRVDPCSDCWKLLSGALDNDAYHVSAPSPSGDGVLRAILECIDGRDMADVATVTAHGTATMYNDQMESKAIEAAVLGNIPVTAYKGCFGHTLGAAGILESIITMRSLDDGLLLPVVGYEEAGVSGRISVCDRLQSTQKHSFVKIISGFGGCNGAALFSRSSCVSPDSVPACSMEVRHSVRITPSSACLDGVEIAVSTSGRQLLTEVFKTCLDDGPKFYKMDVFSRLAYLAAALLIKADDHDSGQLALLFFNQSGSLIQDREHLRTFMGCNDFYPSPGTFLYTLPNVVMGEIAMKYGVKGETSLIMLPSKDHNLMNEVLRATADFTSSPTIITGWVECSSEETFEAELNLITKN